MVLTSVSCSNRNFEQEKNEAVILKKQLICITSQKRAHESTKYCNIHSEKRLRVNPTIRKHFLSLKHSG